MSDAIEKVSKLLAQADGTSNEKERDAYLAAAQRIASANSIELAKARQLIAHGQKREEPTQKMIRVGERGKQLNAVWCELVMAIGRQNDLKFNIAHNSTYVIAFGMPSDIDMTEAMYGHISVQMVDACEAYLDTGEYKDETVTQWDDRRGLVTKRVDRRVAKRQFYESFTNRISLRLMEARAEAVRESKERDAAAADLAHRLEHEPEAERIESTGTELVLRRKAEDVRDFYDKTSTARGSWKGSNNTYRSSSGSSAGRRAGDSANLSGRRGISGPRQGLGR